jgi:hypothetical protein
LPKALKSGVLLMSNIRLTIKVFWTVLMIKSLTFDFKYDNIIQVQSSAGFLFFYRTSTTKSNFNGQTRKNY